MSSLPFWLILASSLHVLSTGDDSYHNVKSLQDSKLSSSTYSTTLRPVENQTQHLQINVSFSIVAIVSLDDVKQEMTTNGFLLLRWKDEVTSWNASDYSGLQRLTPNSKDIWKPRLLLINTLGDRDPFEDDYSHTIYESNGGVVWVPGGLFYTYCHLEMKKFPFDVQECYIQLCPVSLTKPFLQFLPDNEMNKGFYFPNPGWDLLETKQEVKDVDVVDGEIFSCPTFTFKLQRRPQTIILNVILPVVLLSVLNNLVFFIPVESGEKISYAVTVLLSLSVFLSMVSTMTPQVTDETPALTTYLFILLVSSVLTVGASIFIVFLHHKDEQREAYLKSKDNFQRSVRSLLRARSVVSHLNMDKTEKHDPPDEPPEKEQEKAPAVNKYKLMSKHINMISFVLVKGMWLVATICYFAIVNS